MPIDWATLSAAASGSAPTHARRPPLALGSDVAPAAPQRVAYWCAAGHETWRLLAADAEVPDQWECRRCFAPAGPHPDQPPVPSRPPQRYRTPYEYLRERRTEAELEALLAEALAGLHARDQASGSADLHRVAGA